MINGKVSESVLKRSVLKLLRAKNQKVLTKPQIGMDCAQVELSQNLVTLSSVSSGIWPIYTVANNIAACGGEPTCVQCCILLSQDAQEQDLKDIVKSLDADCAKLGMQISGGHTQVSDKVNAPVITVTGIGNQISTATISAKNSKPNQDIVMTKWIGIGGIQAIAQNYAEEILETYAKDILDTAVGDPLDKSILPEAKIALENGITAMHDVSEGGIFAALWEMAQAADVGFTVDFRKIMVKQEIIELCELFELNPYELDSTGCLLMTADSGYDIVKLLNEAGIKAQMIGRTTDGNDRIIQNVDEIRYLNKPVQDALYHLKNRQYAGKDLSNEREDSKYAGEEQQN